MLTPKRFENLNEVIPDCNSMAVAVPSRCYTRPSPKLPLAGAKVSVKDNFALAGIRTSLQCKSFLRTYEAETETAAYIKILIDLRSVIVGKTKMAAFASGEKPCDWWEFQCPFNARGDGYLNPGQSTTGGAAAAGGYAWLDYSIGSDCKSASTIYASSLIDVNSIWTCPWAGSAKWCLWYSIDYRYMRSDKGSVPLLTVSMSSKLQSLQLIGYSVFDTIGIICKNLKLLQSLAQYSLSSSIPNFKKVSHFPRILKPMI